MKKFLFFLLMLFCFTQTSWAQISITGNDVPVANDTLRYSEANPSTFINLSQTGTNYAWDFSTLVPQSQKIDTYKTALSVNPLLLFSYASAYGIRTSLSGLTGGLTLPIPVSDVYYFYQKRTSPNRYVGRGYGATISGTTLPMAYSDDDEIYYLPLAYGHHDSSSYALSTTIPNIGAIQIAGYRITDVDGWGTIITPYYTTPVNCIRLKSVTTEIDSITYNGITFGLPRSTIEYKWLTTGAHYPALYVTANSVFGNEVIASIRFKDQYRPLAGIENTHGVVTQLTVYPNPSAEGKTTLIIPENWQHFVLAVYDLSGKKLMEQKDYNQLDLSAFSKGNYFVQINSGCEMGMAIIQR